MDLQHMRTRVRPRAHRKPLSMRAPVEGARACQLVSTIKVSTWGVDKRNTAQ